MRRELPAGLSRTGLFRTRLSRTRLLRTRRPRGGPSRTRPGGAVWLAALLAGVLAVLLLAPAAAPAGPGSDADRKRAARVVRAHEKVRARVDRLRKADADAPKVDAAERRRKALRDRLWDLLREKARAAGDPVAVDRSGRAGKCAARDRSRPPERDGSAWTAPTRGYWLSAGFADRGARWAHRHTGQDFAVPGGRPVYAVGPGVVHATTCGDGFGRQVVVGHDDGYFTQYAHLSRIDVRTGQRVEAGRRLGRAGATGNVTGPHLHFEVRITPYLGSSVPPLPWLRRKGVEVVRGD
ncbi:M23 family metallopeptidase [Streptomyces sp. NPDC006527]|uniref:M23 family metallopeptidase n=1 Tax=Streptomyces sp. NPDC006527 TaxID=3364749 RepID=UPI0036B25DF7